MANIFRTLSTKFYQNWHGFVDNVTKKCIPNFIRIDRVCGRYDKNVLVCFFRFIVCTKQLHRPVGAEPGLETMGASGT